MSRKDKKITLPTCIGYGLVDVMGGGAFTIIGTFLLFFYTTYCGLTPIQGASIVAVARFVDAIASLFIGSISDNLYKTKIGKMFGRRRFFLLIGAPLMAIYVLIWTIGMNYWFYLSCYLLFEIVAAMVLIPWETLPTEMTTNYSDRTKISTCRLVISSSGQFLGTFIPAQLIGHFGQKNPYAYFYNGLFFAILYAICILITYKVTWEREMTPAMEQELLALSQSKEHKSFNDYLKVLGEYVSTFKIKSFRKHLGLYLLSFTAGDIFSAVFLFFCVYNLKVSSSFGAYLLSFSIIGIPGTIVGGILFLKLGPAKLYKLTYTIMILSVLAYYGVYLADPAAKTAILIVISVVYFAFRSFAVLTPWTIFPFIPDVDEIVSKKRREGLFAAVMTFTRKSTTALATFIIGVVLQVGGFVKGQDVQSPQTVQVIGYVLLIGCVGLLVLSLILAFTFKLDKQTHQILINEVERLKNGGSKNNVDPKTKEVVEELTGYKYEYVWKYDLVQDNLTKSMN
ncbi:MFS transporter [Clostridium sp.]|uniref:MFS transporter n=1 Tax=Clostridium sp. TaxID=1506 RepID=UPI002843DB42|nr:MFS transporter [Clostridium sp.]MDR3595323.1 MFS transporter [Clostridium sp.]